MEKLSKQIEMGKGCKSSFLTKANETFLAHFLRSFNNERPSPDFALNVNRPEKNSYLEFEILNQRL